jgi:predicted small lipoprotein YifL
LNPGARLSPAIISITRAGAINRRPSRFWWRRCATAVDPKAQSSPRLRPPFLYSAGDHRESSVAAQFSYRFGKIARLKTLALLLALGLAACGRYGPLEPPPDPNAPPKPASSNPANMNGGLSKPSIPPIVPPKQPFFLDFLLK